MSEIEMVAGWIVILMYDFTALPTNCWIIIISQNLHLKGRNVFLNLMIPTE